MPPEPQDMRLRLTGSLTVRGIDAAFAEVRDALAQDGPVVIDCGGAEAVDVSLIQLLLAARRGGGARVRLASPLPELLRDALRRGGFLADGAADRAFWQPETQAS